MLSYVHYFPKREPPENLTLKKKKKNLIGIQSLDSATNFQKTQGTEQHFKLCRDAINKIQATGISTGQTTWSLQYLNNKWKKNK